MRNFSSELCECVCEKTPIDVCVFVLVVSLRKQIIESQKLHRWRFCSTCARATLSARAALDSDAVTCPRGLRLLLGKKKMKSWIFITANLEIGAHNAISVVFFFFFFGEAAAKRRREELGSWALETSE